MWWRWPLALLVLTLAILLLEVVYCRKIHGRDR